VSSLVEQVKDRIEAQVSGLTVDEAFDFAELVRQGALPQRKEAAFVLPLGFNAGEAQSDIAQFYKQTLDEVVGIVLVVQSLGDPKAKRAIATVATLTQSILLAVCGWHPAEAVGDFRALRGRLISVNAGTVFFQIEFSIQTQLRFAPP
jgi:hypothetical protein